MKKTFSTDSTAASFSKFFEVPDTVMTTSGAFDVVLNLDTKLFIDPLLLSSSSQSEIRAGRKIFEKHQDARHPYRAKKIVFIQVYVVLKP
jgi:hypothetical protein